MAKFKLKNDFTKSLGKKEILVPYLNNWFANGVFPDEIPFSIHPNKEPDDAFHPSSATACLRLLSAKFDGILPPEITRMDQSKTFMIGHFYHALLQWILVEGLHFAEWDSVEKEYDLQLKTEAGNPYRVRGFLDIARCNIPNQDPVLVDIKTMNARIYAQNEVPEYILYKYRAQVQMYLAFEQLDRAIILCVEKDSPHRFKEVIVEADDDFVDNTIEKWETLVDMRANGEIPPHTCEDEHKCPAKDIYFLSEADIY